MSLSGMDVESVRGLSQRLFAAGEELEAVGVALRSALFAAPWHGSDADGFRALWEDRHAPSLAAVASALRQVGERLDQEAREQEVASQSAGGLVGPAAPAPPQSGPGLSDGPGRENQAGLGEFAWEDVAKIVGVAVSATDKAFEDLKRHVQHVSGYVRRGGEVVDDYYRWARGRAGDLGRLMSAGDAVKVARGLPGIGLAFDVLGAGLDAGKQWDEDQRARPGEETHERWARAVGGGVVSFGASVGVTVVGAAVGQALIPIPGVGALVGAAVANAGYFLADKLTDDKISDALTDVGAWVGSGVDDGVEIAVELGGQALAAGSDLLGEAGDWTGDLVDRVLPW